MKGIGNFIERIIALAQSFSEWLIIIMILLISFEVVMRYIFQQSLGISDEVSGYMLVALSFLGMAYTWKQKGHVRVTALVSRLSPKVADWLRIFTLILSLAFSLVLCYASYNYFALSMRLHLKSSSSYQMPLQVPHLIVLIGYILLGLLLFLEVVKSFTKIQNGQRVEDASL